MKTEHDDWLEELNAKECLELLRTGRVGHIGVVVHGRPEIFPVNYSLDASDAVIFKTAIGTKLAAATNHHVVFEVDQFSENVKSGWSVIVHGVAQQTGRIAEGQHALDSWRDHVPFLVRITQTSITGRRIQKHPGTN